MLNIFLQVSLLKSVEEENKTFLMMDHQICFYGEIWLIIPKISLLPLLINLLQCKSICFIFLQVSLLKSVEEENKTFLMMDHQICFYGEIWLIIPKISLLLRWVTKYVLMEKYG